MQVRVRLLRGRIKRQPNGEHHALVCDQSGGKWYWDSVGGLSSPTPLVSTYLVDADRVGDMLADLAVLRIQGWTLRGVVPRW